MIQGKELAAVEAGNTSGITGENRDSCWQEKTLHQLLNLRWRLIAALVFFVLAMVFAIAGYLGGANLVAPFWMISLGALILGEACIFLGGGKD